MALSPEQRQFCEFVLRNYQQWKRDLAQLEQERSDIITMPGGIVQLPGRRGHKADRTATQACKLLDAEAGYGRARQDVKAVDHLLRLLSPEDKKIIRRLYFRGQTVRETAKAVFMSERTVHYHRNRALELLARLL